MNRYKVGLALVLVIVLRLHNAWVFPPYWGLDANGHCQNLLIVSQELRLPNAQDGWSAYHPPLYHILSSVPTWAFHVDPLLSAKLLSALSSLALMGLVYLAVRQVEPQLALLGALLIGVWPSDVLHSAMCLNIELGAALCALWIVLESRTRRGPPSSEGGGGPAGVLALGRPQDGNVWGRDNGVRWELRWSALGLLSGLILLNRPEGLITIGWLGWVALLDLRSARAGERRQVALGAAWGLTLVALSVGWFYCRNEALYGRWVISNLDGDMFPWSVADPSLGFSWPGFVSPWGWLIPDLSLWSSPQFPGGSGSSLTVFLASSSLDYSNILHLPGNLFFDRILLVVGMVAFGGIAWGALQPGTLRQASWPGLVFITLVFFLLLNLRNPCLTSAKVPYLNPIFLPGVCYLLGAHSKLMQRWPRVGDRLLDVWVAMAILVTWRLWSPSA